MARTTEEAVKDIVEYDVDAEIGLTGFIDTANNLVTRACGTLGYDDPTLELIERWLSAHFYHIRDMRLSEERTSKAGGRYQSKIGMGLDLTHYGQMAKVLDTKGGLSALESQSRIGKVGIAWLGQTREEAELGL